MNRQGRHSDVIKTFGNGNFITQSRTKAGALDLKIVVHDFEFLRHRYKTALIGIQREAQQRRQFADRIFRTLRVGWDKCRDGVERVEQEVWMDARLERRELRFGEQLVGALLLHLARAQLQRG